MATELKLNKEYIQAGALGAKPIERILHEMNEQGQFEAAVLASSEGLPLAAAPSVYDTDTTAAMVAMLQRVALEAREYLKMAEVDEITIFDHDRIRLVCRYLDLDGEQLILAAMVPPYHYYRRVTNSAIRRIKELFMKGNS
jgi:predicted regulator of Ras-like GTPase activity (Roadblock/LC7/MglB family)